MSETIMVVMDGAGNGNGVNIEQPKHWYPNPWYVLLSICAGIAIAFILGHLKK